MYVICCLLTDVSHFSKTAASDMTKAARAKFETRRTSRLSRSTEALPSSAAEATASDIHSRRSSLQQRLFSSARQPSRSAQQRDDSQASGRRRLRRLRQSQSHDEQSVSSSDTSRDIISTDDSQTTTSTGATHRHRQPPSADTSTHVNSDSRPAADAGTASTVPVTRQFRAPAVTAPMPFSSVSGRNVEVSDNNKTACRRPGHYCNAYVFTEQPLLPGDELVVQVTSTDVDYRGGLTFGLTACDPMTLNTIELPDDADKLLDRAEYWVVHKNICSHPRLNDELAFLRTVSGKFCFLIVVST